MLVLSRRVSEQIWLDLPDGQRIELMLCQSRDGRARIGITCPREIRVHRPDVQSGPSHKEKLCAAQ